MAAVPHASPRRPSTGCAPGALTASARTPRVRAQRQAAQAPSRALAPSAAVPPAAPLKPWAAPPNTALAPKPS